MTIDQRGCIYSPRVVGVQLGQPLRVQNSDPTLHNVRGVSPGRDGFNIGQPMAGMINTIQLHEEGVLRVLQCDVHTWMVAFVGVVNHPYFAVTDPAGTFRIEDVPVGSYGLKTWHERYGMLTTSVRVDPDSESAVELMYAGDEGRSDSRGANAVERPDVVGTTSNANR